MGLQVERSRRLSEFSTYGIGGPIQYFVSVSTVEEMEEAFEISRKMHLRRLILGKGSNSLFPDQGFDGLAILNKIDFCEFGENEVVAGAGYSFSLLGVQTARKGMGGLEFASGIPATVGGALYMNAGANGREISECLVSAQYMHADGKREEIFRKDLSFSYRVSPFQKMDGAILFARFSLVPNPDARKNQLQIVEGRMRTQPLKEKSAGCVFRNPAPGVSAGALIDQCGLKGFSVGGAKISEVHANFLINAQSATAADMLQLIRIVQEKVAAQKGIHLELEIKVFS